MKLLSIKKTGCWCRSLSESGITVRIGVAGDRGSWSRAAWQDSLSSI